MSKALKARGCAAIHVSSGGVSPQQKIQLGPGYQVPFAQRSRRGGLPTIAVGLITEPEQAEAIVADGEADAISLARACSTTRAGPGTQPRSSAHGRGAAPVLALAAARVQEPVRERAIRRALIGRAAATHAPS